MRAVKFRAWHTVNKVMYNHKSIPVLLKNIEDDRVWKFMQFIGLRDKNGKEIYEGDLCEAKQPNSYLGDSNDLYEVIYNANMAMFCFKCVFSDNEHRIAKIPLTRNNHPYFITPERTRVVGNIYQNPTLIK